MNNQSGRIDQPEARPGTAAPIVSLTSFPPRIKTLDRTLLSILGQSLMPDVIHVALARGEFPDGVSRFPRRLKKMIDQFQGLIVIDFVDENTRSYKKLIPALTRYGADKSIVTVDDDVIYPDNLISSLVGGSIDFAGATVGTRGVAMTLDDSGRLAPYRSWPQASLRRPSSSVFLTGRGGILYPPESMAGFERRREYLEVAPTADDVWFKMATLSNGFASVRVGSGEEFPASSARQSVGLYRQNNRTRHSRTPNDDALSEAMKLLRINREVLEGGSGDS